MNRCENVDDRPIGSSRIRSLLHTRRDKTAANLLEGDIIAIANDQLFTDQLSELANEGRISRRSFMKYLLAAGMTGSAGLWGTSAKAASTSGETLSHDGKVSTTVDPGNLYRHLVSI